MRTIWLLGLFTTLAMASLCRGPLAAADSGAIGNQTRYYTENGVTYRETRRRVREPVSQTQYRDQTQTVYRSQYTTKMQDYEQAGYAPVTQYYWQPRWHGTWRIFQDPHLAWHLKPHTTWQRVTQRVQVPVTVSQVVPETRTVKIPETQLRFVEREQIERVAVAPQPTLASVPALQFVSTPQVAVAPPIYDPYAIRLPSTAPIYNVSPIYSPYTVVGGIARLDGDPPRYGIGYSEGWRARR